MKTIEDKVRELIRKLQMKQHSTLAEDCLAQDVISDLQTMLPGPEIVKLEASVACSCGKVTDVRVTRALLSDRVGMKRWFKCRFCNKRMEIDLTQSGWLEVRHHAV